jgi:LacI family transcriptional regulator
LPTVVVEGAFDQASGYRVGASLAGGREPPDAIFAGNDMMAVGAMLALQDAGLGVPDDIAVVGFDDVPIAGLMRPGLTTLRINIAETGRSALERLVRLINAAGEAVADTACEVVRPELVVRPSSNPATQARTISGARAREAAGSSPLEGENPQ